jgi:hypothetical protein
MEAFFEMEASFEEMRAFAIAGTADGMWPWMQDGRQKWPAVFR